MSSRSPTALATLAIVVAAPIPALAHHPMGGVAPVTVWEGIASGMAHPIIGLDHFAFLVAAGVLAAAAPSRGGVWALVAFLGAGLFGALLHLGGVGLGPVEVTVALSVLLAGAALLSPPAWLSLATPASVAIAFAAAGLFHGHAYAEAVVGAGIAPVAAYLLTLAVMQAALGLGVMTLVRRLETSHGEAFPQRRWAGMAATVVGAVVLMAAVIA